jgi:hypothetical protein
MRERKPFITTYWVLGVFVVLLIVVVFVDNDALERRAKVNEAKSPLYSEDLIESVDAFEFVSSKGTTLLRLVDDAWNVSVDGVSFLADSSQILELMSILKSFSRGVLVSKTDDTWDSFNVAVPPKLRFKAFSEDSLIIDLFVGNRGRSRNDEYVREADSNKVYLVEGRLGPVSSLPLSSWRDKTLFPIQLSDISSLAVRVGEDKWTFLQDDASWVVEHDGSNISAESSDIRTFLADVIVPLKASGFFEEEIDYEDARLLQDAGVVYVTKMDGSIFELLFVHDEENDKAMALRSDNKEVYRISLSILSSLLPDFSDVSSDEN